MDKTLKKKKGIYVHDDVVNITSELHNLHTLVTILAQQREKT